MKDNAPSREELFALVWEQPATKVARELGISDTALGKLCRRLQVPKPPRGYWARVATGKTPKRPPLPAYQAEIAQQQARKIGSTSQVRLTKLQQEFLSYALDELSSAGVDIKGCELVYDGIRTVKPELAARILILLQNRYQKWLANRTTVRSVNAAMSSLSNFIDKLQPHAQEQLLIMQRRSDDSGATSHGPTLSVRLTHDFLMRLTQLSRLARDNGINYVSVDLSAVDYAFSVRQITSPNTYQNAKTELCVSAREVWIRVEVLTTWSHERFETAHIPLWEIGPVDLIPLHAQKLPAKLPGTSIKPYAERLRALQEAQVIFDALVSAAYDVDRTIPDERLALFDRLWYSQTETGPLFSARQTWRQIESDLERWEQALEREAMNLCRDVLGIEQGDIVIVEYEDQPLRIAAEGMTVYSSETEISFSIWGKRFRKDGLPGKRDQHITVRVENDLESKITSKL